MTPFAGQKIAVLGLGRNGLSAAATLAHLGAEVTAWDDSPAARAEAERAGVTVREAGSGKFGDALVLSPGIPHRLPAPHPVAARALAAGVPIYSDVEFLFRAVRALGSRARFAGITGTNGKSTTTALLAHILRTAEIPVEAGGNLGPAALALSMLGDTGVYCIEMSSYMLERVATLRFDAAVVLNVSADHLDRHGDMAAYTAVKAGIFARQDNNALAVLGDDDAATRALAASLIGHTARKVKISGDHKAGVWAEGRLLRDADGVIADLGDAPALPGAHNAQNAAAAAAMALYFGVDRATLARGLLTYPGLPHRLERIATIGGVTFINDSKATNADSTERALLSYDRVVLIAGGIAKAGGIEPLAPLFPRVAHALLIGRDAPEFASTLSAHQVGHETVETLEAAVPAAFAAARRLGVDTVLLSPACASFDQFTGFDARGDAFRALVQKLAVQGGN